LATGASWHRDGGAGASAPAYDDRILTRGPRGAGPAAPFLERERQMDALRAAHDAARTGAGQLVFVAGEAGVGKSTLVRRFTSSLPDPAVLHGACDPVETPRPLGPLLDMAPALARLAGEPAPAAPGRDDLLALLLRVLGTPREPPVLVFEDVNWGDQATLDLLRSLGRRINRLRALALATLRDDEVAPRSPLSVLLGDLATAAGVTRLPVEPLSPRGTAALVAGSGLDPAAVHERTGGNPFFIGELLTAGAERVPPTVRDVVMARVARLSAAARETLETAAVLGARSTPTVLAALLDRAGTPRWGIQEAVAAGFLVWRDDALAFRHDLARAAIADATDPARRQRLHADALDQLRAPPVAEDGWAELVRHAEAAGDDATVLELAPRVAARASRLSAHREAARLLRKAVERSRRLPPRERLDLLEGRARELYRSGQLDEAVAAHQEAMAAADAAGDAVARARNLSRVAYLRFLVGRYEGSEAARVEALRILEALPPGRELALTCEETARLRFMASDHAGAIRWAERAEALARRVGDETVLVDARVTAAASGLWRGDEGSRAALEVALGEARERGLVDATARALLYLGWVPLLRRCYDGVEERLAEGLRFAGDHELDYFEQLIATARARFAVDQARWHEVEELARPVLDRPKPVSLARLQALVALGRARARRGEAGAAGLLDEALAFGRRHGGGAAVARVWPARVEAAWLAGEPDRALAEARSAAAEGAGEEDPWWHGELAFWVRAAGGSPAPAVPPAPPYALALRGEWGAAAAWWRERGCRYEAAVCLLLGDDAGRALEAVTELDRLGARPAADYGRRRLRALGTRVVPRGPRPSTAGNRAGLTRREQDVLPLIAGGLSNAEIAGRLFLSGKTVERHVSSILRKLDVASRVEAVAAATELGLLGANVGVDGPQVEGAPWKSRRPAGA
jgi:DNA-binding CsgD family transcriptional regulator